QNLDPRVPSQAGQWLDPATHAEPGPPFGHDFRQVRVQANASTEEPMHTASMRPQPMEGGVIAQTADENDGSAPETADSIPTGVGAGMQSQEEVGTPSACLANDQIFLSQSEILKGHGIVGQRHTVAIEWKNSTPPPSGIGASYCS